MAVNPEIKKLTEKIRHTGPADQVRESIAGGMDLTSEEASVTRKIADQTENRQTKVESDFKTLQREYTENGNGAQTTAEISLARDGELVLADRLNRDFGNITAQFQKTEEQLAKTNFMEFKPTIFDEFSERGVNVKWFGAKGNANYYNESDEKYYEDESFTILANDDTEAIQKAIDYIAYRIKQWNISGGWLSGGGTVYFPNGQYLVTKTIIHKPSVSLKGESRYGTVINGYVLDKTHSLTNIEAVNGESIKHRTGNVTNMLFAGSGIYYLQNSMASIDKVSFFNIRNDTNNQIALLLQLTVGMKLPDVQFFGCDRGLIVNGNGGVGPSTTLYIDKMWGAHCSVAVSFSFDKNYITTTSLKNTILEYNDTALELNGNVDINVEDIHFEQNVKDVEAALKKGSNVKLRDVWSDKGTFRFLSSGETDVSGRHKILLKNILSLNPIIIQNGSYADVVLEDKVSKISSIPISARLFNANGNLIQATPPTTLTYSKGDRVEVPAPVAGGSLGYICTVAGNPGTWVSAGTL